MRVNRPISSRASEHTHLAAAVADMLLTPSDDINYNFVAGAYFFASLLCGAQKHSNPSRWSR